MKLLAHAICSSAMLLSGALLVGAAVMTTNREAAAMTGLFGLILMVVGLYKCLRITGTKLYAAQPELSDETSGV